MKIIMYWWSSSCISPQFVDGEAVRSEKVKIITEKSNGRKSVFPFSLPHVLQEFWGGQQEKPPSVAMLEGSRCEQPVGTASF